MAAPRYRFRAHGRSGLRGRQFDKRIEVLAELGGLHIVGIASKGGVAPTSVHRAGFRMAQAAESWHVTVLDAGGGQAHGQSLLTELRIVARARDGSDVD